MSSSQQSKQQARLRVTITELQKERMSPYELGCLHF